MRCPWPTTKKQAIYVMGRFLITGFSSWAEVVKQLSIIRSLQRPLNYNECRFQPRNEARRISSEDPSHACGACTSYLSSLQALTSALLHSTMDLPRATVDGLSPHLTAASLSLALFQPSLSFNPRLSENHHVCVIVQATFRCHSILSLFS